MKLIDFSVTFIFTILNIGVLFVVLRAILFKPVTKFIEARTARIQGDLDKAEKDREEAKRLREEYGEKMRAAAGQARELAETARRAGEERAGALVAEGKAQAEALIAAARKQIAAEEAAALLVFKAEAAALVMRAASRLLQREISGDDARRLAETALAEWGRGG